MCPTIYEPADLVIHIREKGVVLREKSLVALDKETGKILAVGTKAEAFSGRESENIVVMSPLRKGMIADYTVAERMFEFLIGQVGGKKTFLKSWMAVCVPEGIKTFLRPWMAVCVPEGITQVERKAVEDALYQAGAREVVISDLSLEQFLQEVPEHSPDIYRKCRITIAITKEEPESYVKEAFDDILQYAARERISPDRVAELLQKKIEMI